MTGTYIMATLIILSTAGMATADPEQAYQGGKVLRDSVTGTKPNVDDRDLEQKVRDYLREKGKTDGRAARGNSTSEAESKPGTTNSNGPGVK
jgi:hypothetical protein